MKKTLFVFAAMIIGSICFFACSGGQGSSGTQADPTNTAGPEVHGLEIKPGDVQLTSPLNTQWVADGKSIYDLKCQSCHKLTEEKLVGPGWKNITKKREPHWIMNMITNVDLMLEQDPEAQKLLEQCLVRMPNQNISAEDSREILEFMRSNDGEK